MSRRQLPPLHLAAPFVSFLTDLARTQSVYIVGGWLRDGLRGATAQDADFATDADATTVRRFAEAHQLKIFADKVAEQHGTYRMTSGKPFEVLDLATLRCDLAREGARHASVAFTSDIVLDLARRDLTINGMAAVYPLLGPTSGDVLDPFGGQQDLACRRLRLIGEPAKRLDEDPLRLLRVARFACLGPRWRIAPQTRQAMKKKSASLRRISFERIRDELKKSLLLPSPERFWRSARSAGVLSHLWPAPKTFRIQKSIRALRHAHGLPPDALMRLSVFAIAGSRPPASLTMPAQASAQRESGESVKALWLRLKGANHDAHHLGACVAAFPWHPERLHGPALVGWLLTHTQGPVAACRAVTPTLVRAGMASKSELDRLWRRVDSLLEGLPVPTLSDLAIDGNRLLQEGLVQAGPRMGEMLRHLLHIGLETRCWRDANVMLAHAKRMAQQGDSP